MSGAGLKNYVVVPRQIAADYRNGVINRAELNVYLWMRINANPYGIAYMSLETVAEDVLGSSKKKNYANKTLLSLKSKKYIFYEQRSGRRGTFEVHFGDWILPSKNEAGKPIIKNLEAYFNAASVRRKKVLTNPHAELYSENSLQFQRLEKPDKQVNNRDILDTENTEFRGPYNDKDNETENETNRIFSYGKEAISLKEFVPRTYEEEMCLEFARELGETDMRFMLGSLKKHGIQIMEAAFIKVKKAIKKGEAEDPRRLFNYLVQQVAEETHAGILI